MKREDYKNNVWYIVTDENYWVEEYPEEFPNCQTIVCCIDQDIDDLIRTRNQTYIGWGTMAKYDQYRFMIIEKPTITIHNKISKEDLDNLEYFHVNEY